MSGNSQTVLRATNYQAANSSSSSATFGKTSEACTASSRSFIQNRCRGGRSAGTQNWSDADLNALLSMVENGVDVYEQTRDTQTLPVGQLGWQYITDR
jgi:hypothetical protein